MTSRFRTFTLLLFQQSTNHGSGSSSSSRSKFNCEDEGFKYVAGYIAHAFRTKYPEFGSKTCKKFVFERNDAPWIFALSRGGLMAPSPELLEKLHKFNTIFLEIHGDNISRKPNIIKSTAAKICQLFPDFPMKVIQKFVKTRTFIRIRKLNHELQTEAESIRVRNAEKRKHFTT